MSFVFFVVFFVVFSVIVQNAVLIIPQFTISVKFFSAPCIRELHLSEFLFLIEGVSYFDAIL